MKRKMPPHIVLPNGQWRFVKRGSKTKAKSRSTARGYNMARKRRYSRGNLSGGKKIMGLSTKGVVGNFGLLGVGAALLAAPMVGNLIPINMDAKIRNAVGGFVIAGPAGAAASFAKDILMPSGSSSSGNW